LARAAAIIGQIDAVSDTIASAAEEQTVHHQRDRPQSRETRSSGENQLETPRARRRPPGAQQPGQGRTARRQASSEMASQLMSSLDVSVFESAVVGTVRNVFESMLSMSVSPAPARMPSSVERVTAALHFNGAWTGATLLEVSPDMARTFTSRMLGIEVPARVDDEVLDAMGELVNVIGGNLKIILPSGVGLSLPAVVIGTDYSMKIRGGHLVERWTFEAESGPFSVSIIEVQNRGRGSVKPDAGRP
jgi:chemotaxis protein CheX